MRIALVASILLALLINTAARAQQYLPFQALLQDSATGQAVPDGTHRVTVTLFDDAIVENSVYSQVFDSVSVSGARLNLIIGPIPDPAIFDVQSPLFAAVKIGPDTNAYMAPRHRVISAHHARRASTVLDGRISMNSIALAAVTTSKLAVGSVTASNLAPEARGALPVGSVMLWYGAAAAIPFGYELCDGGPATTPGAVLTGNKPDFRGRFAKGAANGVTNVTGTPPLGIDTVPARTTDPHAITLAQMAVHSHEDTLSVNNNTHTHTEANLECADDEGGEGNDHALGDNNSDRICPTITGGGHGHSVLGSVIAAGGGQAHEHSISSHDNRPSFLQMFYIIRVL